MSLVSLNHSNAPDLAVCFIQCFWNGGN